MSKGSIFFLIIVIILAGVVFFNFSDIKNGINGTEVDEFENFTVDGEAQSWETSKKCYVGGCSGEVCSSDAGVVTSCEYREEYACYKNAKCEFQKNGECGWTATSELSICLNSVIN